MAAVACQAFLAPLLALFLLFTLRIMLEHAKVVGYAHVQQHPAYISTAQQDVLTILFS